MVTPTTSAFCLLFLLLAICCAVADDVPATPTADEAAPAPAADDDKEKFSKDCGEGYTDDCKILMKFLLTKDKDWWKSSYPDDKDVVYAQDKNPELQVLVKDQFEAASKKCKDETEFTDCEYQDKDEKAQTAADLKLYLFNALQLSFGPVEEGDSTTEGGPFDWTYVAIGGGILLLLLLAMAAFCCMSGKGGGGGSSGGGKGGRSGIKRSTKGTKGTVKTGDKRKSRKGNKPTGKGGGGGNKKKK